MPQLDPILNKQHHQIDIEVAAFLQQLERMLRRGQSLTVSDILGRLKIEDGEIVNTAENRFIIRRFDTTMNSAMKTLGVAALIDAFAMRVPEHQLPVLHSVLEATLENSADVRTLMHFSPAQTANLAAIQDDMATQIEETIQQAATRARYNALGSIGAETMDLVNGVSGALDKVTELIQPAAADSVMTFYRTAADMVYEKVGLFGPALRFRYIGPNDYINRPFCKHLITKAEGGESWTRAEIATMDNGQERWGKGNVMLYGGGWGCRHQWVVHAR